MIKLGDTVFFDTTTRGNAGRLNADSPPTFSVYENASDSPVVVDTPMVLRTGHIGIYRGGYDVSNDEGFEIGKWYSTIVTAEVGGIIDQTVALTFLLHSRNIDDLPTATSITTMSPLSPDGRKMRLKAGDAYLVANGNQIEFSFKGRPDISAVPLSRMLLGFGFGDDPSLLTLVAVSKTSSPDLTVNQTVTFEMLSAESDDLLGYSPLEFTFEIAYSAAEPSTIIEGPVFVTRRRTV